MLLSQLKIKNKIISPKPVIGFCLILLFSCSGENSKRNVLTSAVERKDYIDKITVSGSLEAIKTVTLVAPFVRSNLTINWLIEEGSNVKKGDTVCILDASGLEEDYSRSVDQYNLTLAEYNKSKADLNMQYLMLESQVNSIDVSTAISRLDSLQLKFTSPLEKKKIELELEKADVEKAKLTNKLRFLQTINESEMKKMELRIKQQQNKINNAIDQLKMTILTSSVDGLVIYARSWQTGEKVAEGDELWGRMPVLEIPQMDELQAELFVNETHFKRIEKDQTVEIFVDAIPEMSLIGKIKTKAPIGKSIRRGSKVKYFEITASLDSAFIAAQPGLSVTCDIFIKKISDTLVIPTVSLFEEDSIKLVYVEKGKKFTKRPVETALGNHKFTVIKSGISEEENIATSKPPESLILN